MVPVERESPSLLDDYSPLPSAAHSPLSPVYLSSSRGDGIVPPEPWKYSLGAGSQALVAFCVLNGLLGLLFSMMFRNQHISFQLAAMHHGWMESQKAKGCHNAAIGYFVVGLLTLLNPVLTRFVGTPSSWFCKAKQAGRNGCRKFVPKEKLSLLGYSRKGSDDSCDDDDAEEMRSAGVGGSNDNGAPRTTGFRGSRSAII